MRNAYKMFIGKHDGKGPRGRLKRRWEHLLEQNLGKLGGEVWSG